MKNISRLILFNLTIGIVLLSCHPVTDVILSVEPLNTNAAPGDTVRYRATVIPEAINGGELGFFYILDRDSSVIFEKSLSGNISDSVIFNYVVSTDHTVGDEIKLIFLAYDGTNTNADTVDVTINVYSGIPSVKESNDVQAVFNSADLTKAMMFVVGTSDVNTTNGSSVEQDIAFVWDDTYGISLVSPNSGWITDIFNANAVTYTTSDKKDTKLQRSDSSWTYFNEETINNLNIESALLQGGSGYGVQNLSEGDILIFELQDGRKGALKVLYTSTENADKYIGLDFIYQTSTKK